MSPEQYLIRFRKINWEYHNDAFIKYWWDFLQKLIKNPNTQFKYLYNYTDEACQNCDIIEECQDKNTTLNKIVHKLDDKFLIDCPEFKLWSIYKIKDLLEYAEVK